MCATEHKPDYSSYIKGYQERLEKQRARLKQLREHVLVEAKKLALFLATQYNVDLVVLFGSYAKGTHRIGSDVDIAIQGLNSGDYWKAWSEVDRLTDLSIDFLCLEDFPESSRKLILEYGVILFKADERVSKGAGEQPKSAGKAYTFCPQ